MTTARSTPSPNEARPALSDEAMPAAWSGLIRTAARPKSTRLQISSAAAPSTTRTSSSFDAQACPTTSSSSGLPLTCSSCLGLPMRREEPAASTRPALVTVGGASGLDASEETLGFLFKLAPAPGRAEPVGHIAVHGLVL